MFDIIIFEFGSVDVFVEKCVCKLCVVKVVIVIDVGFFFV